jgi:aryl sulfotransferase
MMQNLPKKTKDIKNHHMDSTFWDNFNYRPDDIIIASYIKSGTTWLQQIVGQLIFDGEEGLPIAEISPWLDLRFPPREEKLALLEKQTHRRFVKTHLPANAVVLSNQAKYLFIGRDGRDIVWSMHHHYSKGNELMYQALNETPGRVGPEITRPPESIEQYFSEWLNHDGFPIWSFWENIQTWWDLRHCPNVKLLHYNNLKQDIGGQIRGIADFLEIDIDKERLPEILTHCSFDYMKENANPVVPLEGELWQGGAKTFINKGINKRWEGSLSEEKSQRYELTAKEKLGKECANWLATGRLEERI